MPSRGEQEEVRRQLWLWVPLVSERDEADHTANSLGMDRRALSARRSLNLRGKDKQVYVFSKMVST